MTQNPGEAPDTSQVQHSNGEIIGLTDLSGRLRFFAAIAAQSLLDLAILVVLLVVLILGKMAGSFFEKQYPEQVAIIHIGEWVALFATGITWTFYVITDIIQTMRRTWTVLTKEGK